MKNATKGSRDKYFKRLVRSQVLTLDPYVPGPTDDRTEVVKISANENDFGTPPPVRQAIRAQIGREARLNRYPDSSCSALREALSREFGLPSEWFLVGNGLDDIINMLALTFLAPDDEVVIPAMTFVVYESVTRVMGAQPVIVPMKDDLSTDVDGIANAVTPNTKMIFLCNPNNPTGSIVHTAEFDHLVESLSHMPVAPLLVADQAYIDYVDPHEDYLNAINYVQDYPNMIVLRTFSKISGLAGLRVGYAIAHPELLSYIYRIRPPYTVNSLAQAAAIADVSDDSVRAYKRRVKKSVKKTRDTLQRFLTENGVPCTESHANFVFAFYDRPYEELAAISATLADQGILVRTLQHEHGPDGLRFSIGTPEENDRLMTALRQILAKDKGNKG